MLWSSLLITDFSSIVFDFIYRGKPIILFTPDILDQNLNEIYNKEYSELIQSIKNGTIVFENQYLNVNEAINNIFINIVLFIKGKIILKIRIISIIFFILVLFIMGVVNSKN